MFRLRQLGTVLSCRGDRGSNGGGEDAGISRGSVDANSVARAFSRSCSQWLVYIAVICSAVAWPKPGRTQSFLGDFPVDVHGFVSQGFLKSTHNNYLAETTGGSFEFTEVGLNVTKSVTDELRIGIQLFSRDLGPIGNYRPQVDWFYLDYRFWDWLGLRAGRTKLPFGLLNEVNDIDAARVPALLPQSIYSAESRDYLLAQTGAELYGYVPLGAPGSLEYRVYGGTIFIDFSSNPAVSNPSVPYVVGGRLMWLPPINALQLGGSVQALKLKGDIKPTPELIAYYQARGVLPADFAGSITLNMPIVLWVASVEYAPGSLYLAAEYCRWHVNATTSPEVLTEAERKQVNERFYVMGSYRVNSWFTPGIYYSGYFPLVNDRSGANRAAQPGGSQADAYQHDVAVTLRYDLATNWIMKAEFHAMHGTAAVSSSLNPDTPRRKLSKNWGLLVLKTTAHF